MSLHCYVCGDSIREGDQCADVLPTGESHTSTTGLYLDEWYSSSSVHRARVWLCSACYHERHKNDEEGCIWAIILIAVSFTVFMWGVLTCSGMLLR